MKAITLVSAALGVLFFLAGVYSRFSGVPGVRRFGYAFASGSLVLVGNTFLLIAVLLVVWSLQEKK